MRKTLLIACAVCAAGSLAAERNAYFGDLHVHTRFSFDAFSFATRGSPDDAYRFATGGHADAPRPASRCVSTSRSTSTRSPITRRISAP